MPRFYTVDRRGTLHNGQTLGLTRYDDVNPSHLQRHLDVLFPDGVAAHGETTSSTGMFSFRSPTTQSS